MFFAQRLVNCIFQSCFLSLFFGLYDKPRAVSEDRMHHATMLQLCLQVLFIMVQSLPSVDVKLGGVPQIGKRVSSLRHL